MTKNTVHQAEATDEISKATAVRARRRPRPGNPSARTSATYRDLTALFYRVITALPAAQQDEARAAARQGPQAIRAHLCEHEPAFAAPDEAAPATRAVLTFVVDHVDWVALAARLGADQPVPSDRRS